jgi:hypothetical protein
MLLTILATKLNVKISEVRLIVAEGLIRRATPDGLAAA